MIKDTMNIALDDFDSHVHANVKKNTDYLQESVVFTPEQFKRLTPQKYNCSYKISNI
jgi:hypothetical protein